MIDTLKKINIIISECISCKLENSEFCHLSYPLRSIDAIDNFWFAKSIGTSVI